MGKLSVSRAKELHDLTKMGRSRLLFCLFSIFSAKIWQKNVDFSGIQTRIIGVEGEHTDHLTTTTVLDGVTNEVLQVVEQRGFQDRPQT